MWFEFFFSSFSIYTKKKKEKERANEWEHWIIEYKYTKKKIRLQIQKNSCKTTSKCGKWFFAFLTDIEKSIEWMRKSVEWGIEKNYHYELKIGIAEKIFIHSEFNNRKGKKLDFSSFFIASFTIHSFCLGSSHHHDAFNAPKCECVSLQIERHTFLNMSNITYLYRIQLSTLSPSNNEIIKQWHNAFIQNSFSPANAFYFFFSIPYKRQFSIIHLAFSLFLCIAVNPVLLL